MSTFIPIAAFLDSLDELEGGLKVVEVPLDAPPDTSRFTLPQGWNVGIENTEPSGETKATLTTGGVTAHLTRECLGEIAKSFGLRSKYVENTPGALIEPHLNYWLSYSPPGTSLRLQKNRQGVITSLIKGPSTPFFNKDLLQHVLNKVNPDLYATDPLTRVSMDLSSLRLVIPQLARKVGEDVWIPGLQIQNSLTIRYPVTVSGYLHSESVSSGAILHHAQSRYNRRQLGADSEDLTQWFDDSLALVADSLEHEFEIIESLRNEKLGDTPKVLADVFKSYKVPLAVRDLVVDNLLDSQDRTFYGLMQAVIQTATTPGLPDHFITAIMEIGAAAGFSGSDRCGKCRQTLH